MQPYFAILSRRTGSNILRQHISNFSELGRQAKRLRLPDSENFLRFRHFD